MLLFRGFIRRVFPLMLPLCPASHQNPRSTQNTACICDLIKYVLALSLDVIGPLVFLFHWRLLIAVYVTMATLSRSHVGHPTTVSASAWAVPLQSHHPHHQATRLPVQHSLSTPLPLQPQVPPDNTAPSSQVPPANTAPSPQIPPVHALPSPQEPPVHATPSPRIPPIHALPSPQEPPAPSLQDPPVHAIPSPQVPPVHALPSTEAVTETFDTSTKAIGPRTVVRMNVGGLIVINKQISISHMHFCIIHLLPCLPLCVSMLYVHEYVW